MRFCKSERGVTLIELLVTVVILGFAVALMSGAFSQIAQMLRISTEHSNGFLGRWNQSRALYEMVGNMVIDPSLNNPFTGRPQQLDMVTTAMPEGPPGVARRARLHLRSSINDSNSTDLILENLTIPGDEAAVRLARFTGRLEFRYADHTGQEQSQWPPSGVGTYRPMPSAIIIGEAGNRRQVIRMASFEGNLSPKDNALKQAFGLDK